MLDVAFWLTAAVYLWYGSRKAVEEVKVRLDSRKAIKQAEKFLERQR